MFEVNNGVAKINGISNKRDDKNITNPSADYGKNAIQNYYSFLEQPLIKDNNATPPILDFSTNPNAQEKNIEEMDKFVKANDDYLNSLPPLEFEYRYMPNIHKKGDIDTNALFGTAYEEMGRRKEVNTEEINQVFGVDSNPIDLNKDGKIDLAEYSTTILTADMLSKSDTPDINNIDGTINNKGLSKVYEYTQKSNAQAATQLYSSLYNKFNLGEEVKKFNP